MGEHARLSASGCHRWIPCGGSVRLCANVASTSGPDAQLGTAVHALNEMAIKEGKEPALWIGKEIANEDGSRFTVTEEMAEASATWCEVVRELIQAAGPEGTFVLESRVDLSWLHPGLFGTLDCAVLDRVQRTLHVLDYKNGRNAVEVEWNPQLLYYALGALHRMAGDTVDTVVCHIVQPNGIGIPAHQRWVVPVEEVRAWGVEVLKVAAVQADDPQAPLHAGPHCRWCPAKGAGICPEIQRYAGEIARTEFLAPNLPKVETLSIEQMARVVDALELLTAWGREAEGALLARLQAGEKAEGWKVVQSSTKRRWRSDEALAFAVGDLLPEDEVWQKKPKGIGEIEKSLKLRKLDHRKILADATEKPEGRPMLARSSDPRPALVCMGGEFMESAEIFG